MSWGQADSERRIAALARIATVTAVDPAKARARVTYGGETNSAWLPFTSPGAGAIGIWSPPSIGQQVLTVSPGGDTAQGIIVGSIPSDSNPAPSGDGGAFVVEIGPARLTITGDGLIMQSGGVSLALTGAGLAITGGTVTHNGTDIGSTHRHDGVSTGSAQTGTPV